MQHCVYILHSPKLNRFYTGETANLETRLEFHANATTNKFTGKANDWQLFLKISCTTKKQATAIEAHIKRMKSSTYIKNLKKYPEMVEKLLLKYASESAPR